MHNFKFSRILTEEGWKKSLYVTCDRNGIIEKISSIIDPNSVYQKIPQIAVPGFQNSHSHAFQYAMAGMAEELVAGHTEDDFWGWREVMYQLALKISPEQMYVIGKTLYSQMLKLGYTSVVEFHYLHHDKDGKPFHNLAEMGLQLMRAADEVGINITLIPVYYHTSDFGKVHHVNQRRFISQSIDDYWRLIESSEIAARPYTNANVGIGIHSLRAAPLEHVKIILSEVNNKPIHIHISEQMKEVDSCVKFCGKRPVEWLLENTNVNHLYNLVHATHMNESEVKGVAESGATVVICPTTEANLGDGIFPLLDYLKYNGNFSIGSDSHISISPLDEIKLIDYAQRLISRKRNVICNKGGENSGNILFSKITAGGFLARRQGLGADIKVGNYLNLTLLDPMHPVLGSREDKNILSSLIYGADQTAIVGTVVRGNIKMVNESVDNHYDFHNLEF